MNGIPRELIQRVFDALGERDQAAMMALVADDAVFFDPHYPKPEMRGKTEIAAGIDWGLSVMKSFGFTIERYFEAEDGLSGCVEVDTHHELKNGQKLHFPQVFIVETDGERITALRAYEPYGPNGIGGFFLGLERLKRRVTGKA